jgi:hypothetical protein
MILVEISRRATDASCGFLRYLWFVAGRPVSPVAYRILLVLPRRTALAGLFSGAATLQIVAPNVPPRKATRGGWKFAALFCVHNLPGGAPENVEFLIMPRAGRWSARPVFLIVHDSLTRLSA